MNNVSVGDRGCHELVVVVIFSFILVLPFVKNKFECDNLVSLYSTLFGQLFNRIASLSFIFFTEEYCKFILYVSYYYIFECIVIIDYYYYYLEVFKCHKCHMHVSHI